MKNKRTFSSLVLCLITAGLLLFFACGGGGGNGITGGGGDAELIAFLNALPDRTGLSKGLSSVEGNSGVGGTGYTAARDNATAAKNWFVQA